MGLLEELASGEKVKHGTRRRNVVALFILFTLFAVPVWWKTTEIHRAPLPWNLLHAPPAAGVATIRMQLVFSKQIAIGIGTEELRSISEWVDHTLESMYESHHGVKASVLEPTVIESGDISLASPSTEAGLDQALAAWVKSRNRHDTELYTIFLLSTDDTGGIESSDRLVMGTSRHGWLTCDPSTASDAKALRSRASSLPRAALTAVVGHPPTTSLVTVGTSDETADKALAGGVLETFPPQKIRLKLSMLVEGGGASGGWEIEDAIERFLRPFARSLEPMYDVYFESQILHHANIAVPPVWNDLLDSHVLGASTLNDFINSKDWNLDATSSSVKTFHLLLFVPSPKHSPLTILDTHGNPIYPCSFLVSGFGGVSIHNGPTGERIGVSDLEATMEIYVGLLRQLLGVDAGKIALWVRSLSEASSGVTEWQKASLARRSAFSRISHARRTLGSLEALITSIQNMVIHDETADQISASISQLLEAEAAWSRGNFTVSAVEASKAEAAAESSFFHATMLSMLYFPDDHKSAIYIPFFVPALVPLVLALLREGKSMRQESRMAKELASKQE